MRICRQFSRCIDIQSCLDITLNIISIRTISGKILCLFVFSADIKRLLHDGRTKIYCAALNEFLYSEVFNSACMVVSVLFARTAMGFPNNNISVNEGG